MRMSTKTLASLLTLTAAATVPLATRRGYIPRPSRYERLLRHHDRKGELRAEVLSISPLEFRALQKNQTMDEIIRKHGFADELAFRKALRGRISLELQQRGWSDSRISDLLARHSAFAR